MKYIGFISFVFTIFITIGCNFNSGSKVTQTATDNWNSITIVSEENTVITINSYDDTSVIKFYHRGSLFQPLLKNEKVKVDTSKVIFTKVERDSVYSIINDIILNPPTTDRFCTEFVGDLNLIVDYGSLKRSIEYNSVCNWSNLSDKTMQLNNILQKKIWRLKK